MKEIIEVGKIINVHGLKGELKIDPYTDTPEDFNNFEYLIIKDKPYNINKIRIYKGKVFIELENVNSRETAESLKNLKIFIPREFTDNTEEDEFLLVDLIGLSIVNEEGNDIGILKDILQTSGPVDNFVIKTEEKDIYVPALKEYFSIDLNNKKIIGQIPEGFYNL